MASLRSTAFVAALALVAPATAVAATLDFASVCCGLISSPLTFPEATVTGTSSFGTPDGLFIDPERGDWLCPLTYFSDFFGSWCSGDLDIVFSRKVTNLKFFIHAYEEPAMISAFTSNGNLLGSATVGGASGARIDFSHLGPIGRVFIEDLSPPQDTGDTIFFGYGFDVANFSFDQQAVIPLPSTLVLFLGAFGLSGLFLRRRASPANSPPLPS